MEKVYQDNQFKRTVRRNFQADFLRHMHTCESNYWRLVSLLSLLDDNNEWRTDIDSDGVHLNLVFRVVETSRFTQTLHITFSQQRLAVWKVQEPVVVRLYHDVKAAEVVNTQSYRQLMSHYPYPNEKMYQPDEKLQRNCFLRQLLNQCLVSA